MKNTLINLIIDECMVIGQQRLLLILGISANKLTARATNFSDTRILSIMVRPSWKAIDIAKSIEKVTEKMKKKPLYVISDGANNLRAGINESGLIRICDVSHQIAILLEKNYKDNAVFITFNKEMSMSKFKGIMQAHAYLLPRNGEPSQTASDCTIYEYRRLY